MWFVPSRCCQKLRRFHTCLLCPFSLGCLSETDVALAYYVVNGNQIQFACCLVCLFGKGPCIVGLAFKHVFVCLPVCLSVRPSVCLSARLSVRSSVCLSARLSVCLSVFRPALTPRRMRKSRCADLSHGDVTLITCPRCRSYTRVRSKTTVARSVSVSHHH